MLEAHDSNIHCFFLKNNNNNIHCFLNLFTTKICDQTHNIQVNSIKR